MVIVNPPILRTNVLEDRAADTRHVRALGNVVRVTTHVTRAPHQHIVGQMLDNLVALGDVGREDLAEQSNVLVVPRVAVRHGGAIGNRRNLLAVIPPTHDARIGRRVVTQPPIGLAKIVKLDLASILKETREKEREKEREREILVYIFKYVTKGTHSMRPGNQM